MKDAGATPSDDKDSEDVKVKTIAVPSKHKCEETLLSLCRSYGIRDDLYKPVCAKHGWDAPPPEASSAVCVFEAMLEAGVRFPLHELYNKILTHFNLAPSQLVPKAWRHLVGFVLLCDEVGVPPMAAVFRYYFKLCPNGNGWYQFRTNCFQLFELDGGFYVHSRWREMFFFLDSLTADNPWRCPQKLGKPVKEAYDSPDLSDTAWKVISKLNATRYKRKKSVSLKKIIIGKSRYNHNFPILPPLQEQVKSETTASDDDDDATPNIHPDAKRLCLPATATAKAKPITPPRQSDIGTTSSAPPGFALVKSPSNKDELSRTQMVCQMMQDADRELRLAKEELASEQAARAKTLEDLEAEQSKARQLMDQLKEMGAELTVRRAAQAEHTARVRQLEAEHAAKVHILETDLQAAQAEGVKALRQLKEMAAELTKVRHEAQAEQTNHTDRVCQLRNDFEAAEAEHATKLNRLVEEHKEAEANLQKLTQELQAEKAKHGAEVNAIRAQCYSQFKAKAAAIKYINELMPELPPVMGVAGSKVADNNLQEESAGVARSKVSDSKLLEEPAAIEQVKLMGGEKTHACETDPLHSLLHFERPINENTMDAIKILIETGTKPAKKTTVTKTAAASEAVDELMAA